jgi:hypothetical protein
MMKYGLEERKESRHSYMRAHKKEKGIGKKREQNICNGEISRTSKSRVAQRKKVERKKKSGTQW